MKPGPRAAALAALAVLAIAGCTPSTPITTPDPATAPATTQAADPATEYACQQFFGDPDYTDPQAYEVIAMGASALKIGGTNDAFFESVSEDVAKTFEESTDDVKNAASTLGDWFLTEPAKGADANVDSLEAALTDLAKNCAPMSEAAAWQAGVHAEPGTKPAALVCSEIAVKPSLFTPYGNGNVLTQNMFSMVGLGWARGVPASRHDQVQAVYDYLEAEKTAVDDEGVAKALERIQEPFANILEGKKHTGLREAMDEWAPACAAAGYQGSLDIPQEEPGSESEGGLAGE